MSFALDFIARLQGLYDRLTEMFTFVKPANDSISAAVLEYLGSDNTLEVDSVITIPIPEGKRIRRFRTAHNYGSPDALLRVELTKADGTWIESPQLSGYGGAFDPLLHSEYGRDESGIFRSIVLRNIDQHNPGVSFWDTTARLEIYIETEDLP